MFRGALAVAGFTIGGLAAGLGPAPAPASTAPPDAAAGSFEVPTAMYDALDGAGLGALFEGTEYPTQPDGVPWPTDAWPTGPLPEAVDAALVQDALALAFGDNPVGSIDAVVAIQGGLLVLQRYSADWDPDAAHVSWSMAKSITQAMLGILVADGSVDPWGVAPVPEWADESDPRHAITIDELLHMRSGLEWTEEYSGTSDVTAMLFGTGAADRAHFAASKPLESPPGTVWEYSTGTSMILARVIADQVGYFDEGTDWAQEHLFDPLGITSVEHDLDDSGVMSGGSNINMTALDFARFGYLYLRGGRWDGSQIVPEAWVDFARMPRPDAPEYGAHWWVNGTDPSVAFPMMFSAQGFNGQLIFVIPELDAVIVVLSNDGTDLPDRVAWTLVDAFAPLAR